MYTQSGNRLRYFMCVHPDCMDDKVDPLILVNHMIQYDTHRAVVDAINMATLNYNKFLVPLNKGDDLRTKDKRLISTVVVYTII